jgi:hypothetical protein
MEKLSRVSIQAGHENKVSDAPETAARKDNDTPYPTAGINGQTTQSKKAA